MRVKKMMAILTAFCCALSCAPMMAQRADAVTSWDFCVIGMDYAEDGVTPEAWLLMRNLYNSYVAVTAEEMTQYLEEDSALPQLGDMVTARVDTYTMQGDAPGWFNFDDASSLVVSGTVDAYYPVQREYMVIREQGDGEAYLLQDTADGDRFVYTPRSFEDYEVPYHMDGADVGDTVTFTMQVNEEEGYELLFLPRSLQKGDGTVPELPEPVISGEYYTSPVVVIGEDPDYPDSYLVSMGGVEISFGGIFEHSDTGEYPECGDVLMVDYYSIAESYPGQLVVPRNGKYVNIGKAAELYGTMTATVTENTGYSLKLEDAQGNTASYSYYIMTMDWPLHYPEAAEAQPGDVLTFALNEHGKPVMAMNEADLAALEPAQPELLYSDYVVTGVDDAENPQNYVIQHASPYGGTCYLRADMVENFLLPGSAQPAFGDVLRFHGTVITTEMAGINSMTFLTEEGDGALLQTDGRSGIENLGSILEKAERKDYRVETDAEFAGMMQVPVQKTDGDTVNCMFYNNASYACPGGVRLDEVENGDFVTFLTYNGVPVLPATVRTLGDTDASGSVDASDAAGILMKAAELGTGGTAEAVDHALMDVNADGGIDANDAAHLLVYAARAGASEDMPDFETYVTQRLEAPEYEGAQYVSMILGDIFRAFSDETESSAHTSFLITSPAEMEAFVKTMLEIDDGFWTRTSTDAAEEWNVPLTDTVAKYDAAWFREHDLIMVIAIESATQFSHAVRGITENEDGSWTVNIDRLVPSNSEQTLPSFAIFVETNKAVEFAPSVQIEMTNVYVE